ncbi:unnamed protein product [Schistosoma margrebowiei]|uniref:Uncharacterized protein n=1 Tax=Schistosoma margrebowiei TaxID=48269 RepID=A0A183M225_9TREM|nr:unnamed protein product [Schistosoma margrebowiei]
MSKYTEETEILSDSPSDNNSQFIIQKFPKTIIISNQYSNNNNNSLSNFKLNMTAQYNNQYHDDNDNDDDGDDGGSDGVIEYDYSNQYQSRNHLISDSTIYNTQQKFNNLPLNYSLSLNSFNENIPRKLSTLTKCIKYIHHQLMNSSLTFGNYLKNKHVYNSQTKLLMMESKLNIYHNRRFYVRACLVMQFDDLRNVCLIHFNRLFLISSSAGSWFVLSHSRLLLMVSGQWMLSILRRQLFINTCTLLMVVVVVLQVSAPYSRTALTFVLKIPVALLELLPVPSPDKGEPLGMALASASRRKLTR